MSDAPVLVAVAGNIGSGKTTLTRRLAEIFGFQPLFEPSDDNPYLADFYEDMRRYALPLQLRFLADRVQQLRDAQLHHVSAIQDRTCYEDAEIFARKLHEDGSMDERDWQTYERVASPLLDGLPAPDLLVYLRKSADVCADAVKRRGRSFEQSLPRGYLASLGAHYDRWFEAYTRGPRLCIDGDDLDIVDRPEDLERIVTSVRNALPQPQLPF